MINATMKLYSIWELRFSAELVYSWYNQSKQSDNTIMERLQELIRHMQDQMRADLKRSGDYDQYGEEGIRIAVYEDLNDSIKSEFSDILYK